MKLEKISAFAEILSSVAIVVTLAYLAVQTQQNTAALRSSARQQTLASSIELLRMYLDYPESGPGGAAVDPATSRRNTMATATIRMREHDWLQFQDGQLDEATFQSTIRVFIANLRQDGNMRRLWNAYSRNGALHPNFAAYIDAVLADDLSEDE